MLAGRITSICHGYILLIMYPRCKSLSKTFTKYLSFFYNKTILNFHYFCTFSFDGMAFSIASTHCLKNKSNDVMHLTKTVTDKNS